MEQRLEELCALSRFPREALDRYPAELSGGQRQRVSLMRALMLAPEVLLLDEPLGALDPLVRSALQRDLKEIFARLKQTAILVTHDMGEAAYLADEIVLMNRGPDCPARKRGGFARSSGKRVRDRIHQCAKERSVLKIALPLQSGRDLRARGESDRGRFQEIH